MKKQTILVLLAVMISIAPVFAQLAGEKPGSVKPVTGETKGWPSKERLDFIRECVNTAKVNMSEDSARFYCYCMQERIEIKYPTIEEAGKITEAEMQSPAWQKYVTECLAGTWSSTTRNDFISSCITTAKVNLSEEKAKTYCECMQFKIEKAYPNEADLSTLSDSMWKTPEWKKIIQGCMDF